MLNYFLFFIFLFYVLKSNKEGFSKNLNESGKPDTRKFYPMLELNKLKFKNIESYSLVPNNYKIINHKIENTPSGLLNRNTIRLAKKLNVYEPYNYFVSPISKGASKFDLNFKSQFDYGIIQHEDKNRIDLLEKEDTNDKLINDPYYYYSHPNNINVLLHSEEFTNKMLNEKEFASNIEKGVYKGRGIHSLNTE